MKELLIKSEAHRIVVLIALAIALGITVHQVFFVVAQGLALAVCIYLFVVALRQHRTGKAHTR